MSEPDWSPTDGETTTELMGSCGDQGANQPHELGSTTGVGTVLILISFLAWRLSSLQIFSYVDAAAFLSALIASHSMQCSVKAFKSLTNE